MSSENSQYWTSPSHANSAKFAQYNDSYAFKKYCIVIIRGSGILILQIRSLYITLLWPSLIRLCGYTELKPKLFGIISWKHISFSIYIHYTANDNQKTSMCIKVLGCFDWQIIHYLIMPLETIPDLWNTQQQKNKKNVYQHLFICIKWNH